MKNLQRGCYLLNDVLKVSLLKQTASCPCSNTRILWMWPCLENKVFANVIKLRSLCWDHLDYPGDPKSNDKCPHQRQKRRHTKRLRKCDCRGRAWRDASKSQGPWGALEAGRHRKALPRASRGVWLQRHLECALLDSRTVREPTSVMSRHQFVIIGSDRHRKPIPEMAPIRGNAQGHRGSPEKLVRGFRHSSAFL